MKAAHQLGTITSLLVLAVGVAAHLFNKGAANEATGSWQLGKSIPTRNLYRCGYNCVFLGSYRATIDPRGAAMSSKLPANTQVSKISEGQLTLYIPLDSRTSRLPAFPLASNLTPPTTKVVGWSYPNKVYFDNGTVLQPRGEGLTAYPVGSWWYLTTNDRNVEEITFKLRLISSPTIRLATGARYYRDDPNEPPPPDYIVN